MSGRFSLRMLASPLLRKGLSTICAMALAGCAGSRLQMGQTPDGEVIEAVGEAVMDQDLLASKQKSLVDAQKKAVEMVVGVHVSARTLVEKAVQIESKILARTDGYIKKYDILKEWQEPPFYKTRIRALVSYQQIADDLRALGLLSEPNVGHPRVAVLLTEDVQGLKEDSAMPLHATSAVVQAFLDKGYRVVDRGDLMAAKAEEVAQQVEKGDLSRVAGLGKELDAEILLFGEAKASPLTGAALGGLLSYRTTISVQAFKAQTNEVMMTASEVASGLDATKDAAMMKSLQAAGKLAGEKMAGQLAEEMMRRSYLAVSVTGVADLNRLKTLEKTLSTVPGLGDFYLRSYGSGSARLDVRMQKVSPSEVASAIEKSAELKAKVQGVTQESIQVHLE